MSAATGTKIFGITVKASPKLVLGVLGILLAAALWYGLHDSDDAPATSATRTDVTVPSPVPFARTKGRAGRRETINADRGVLRIKTVDATDGSIDPTLRTDLLVKLQSVEPLSGSRSLFEAGPTAEAASAPPIQGPKIPVHAAPPPVTQQPVNVAPSTPVVNIPLRYYGFVNPLSKREAARGLFMDGDNILVAKEGEQLEGRYLVVALNANNARMEDMQMRQGQILPVTPEAMEQQ